MTSDTLELRALDRGLRKRFNKGTKVDEIAIFEHVQKLEGILGIDQLDGLSLEQLFYDWAKDLQAQTFIYAGRGWFIANSEFKGNYHGNEVAFFNARQFIQQNHGDRFSEINLEPELAYLIGLPTAKKEKKESQNEVFLNRDVISEQRGGFEVARYKLSDDGIYLPNTSWEFLEHATGITLGRIDENKRIYRNGPEEDVPDKWIGRYAICRFRDGIKTIIDLDGNKAETAKEKKESLLSDLSIQSEDLEQRMNDLKVYIIQNWLKKQIKPSFSRYYYIAYAEFNRIIKYGVIKLHIFSGQEEFTQFDVGEKYRGKDVTVIINGKKLRIEKKVGTVLMEKSLPEYARIYETKSAFRLFGYRLELVKAERCPETRSIRHRPLLPLRFQKGLHFSILHKEGETKDPDTLYVVESPRGTATLYEAHKEQHALQFKEVGKITRQ